MSKQKTTLHTCNVRFLRNSNNGSPGEKRRKHGTEENEWSERSSTQVMCGQCILRGSLSKSVTTNGTDYCNNLEEGELVEHLSEYRDNTM